MVKQFDVVGFHYDVFQGLLLDPFNKWFAQIWLKDLRCQYELHCVQTYIIKPFV